MLGAAQAGRSIAQAFGVRLGVGDQFLGRLEGGVRAHDQHDRRIDGDRQRREVLERVVVQFFVDGGIDGHDAVGREAERIAVGRLAAQEVGGDRSARSGPVLDDHRLLEFLAQVLAHHARERVRAGAGDVRHDQFDRFGGIGVGRGRLGGGCQANRSEQKFHPVLDGKHQCLLFFC
ncbi:hypothetical protein D9M68_869060 [compost metagenome]